jgi:hypothetical protein
MSAAAAFCGARKLGKGAAMIRRPASAPLAVLCAIGASILLAACGSSTPKATGNSQENEQKLVQFAKCLREHGVNVTTSTGGPGKGGLRINGTNPNAMQAAQNACKRYQPSGGNEKLTPQEKVEREEQVQRFAKCMREHGINVHASTAGGGIQIGIEAHGNGPNPESPTFQAAQTACQKLLPRKGPGPGGAAPGPGPPGSGPSTSSAKPGDGPSSGASLQLGG